MLLTVLSDTYFTATRIDHPGVSHSQKRESRKAKKQPRRLRPLAGAASLFAAGASALVLFG